MSAKYTLAQITKWLEKYDSVGMSVKAMLRYHTTEESLNRANDIPHEIPNTHVENENKFVEGWAPTEGNYDNKDWEDY